MRPESPESVLFDAARAYVARVYGPSRRPVRIKLTLDDGEPVSLPVPLPWHTGRGEDPAPGPGRANASARRSPDFRSVNWFGESYSFTEPQAAAVQLLWEAWEAGAPDVGDKTLLRATGADSVRLGDVFRGSPGWGQLIVEGLTRGTHRLADPSFEVAGPAADS